jgi:hypothetical protein
MMGIVFIVGLLIVGIWIVGYALMTSEADAMGDCANCGRTTRYHALHDPRWCGRPGGRVFTPRDDRPIRPRGKWLADE